MFWCFIVEISVVVWLVNGMIEVFSSVCSEEVERCCFSLEIDFSKEVIGLNLFEIACLMLGFVSFFELSICSI